MNLCVSEIKRTNKWWYHNDNTLLTLEICRLDFSGNLLAAKNITIFGTKDSILAPAYPCHLAMPHWLPYNGLDVYWLPVMKLSSWPVIIIMQTIAACIKNLRM